MVRRKYIRSLAAKILYEQNITCAPVNVTEIARSLGIEVQEKKAAEDELSGFLYRDRERSVAIVGVNANHHQNRRNFTIAHECGHFLLHDFDDVHVDRFFKVWHRSEASSQGIDLEEKEANLFAAELLMPASFLENDIDEIDKLDLESEQVVKNMAARYGVSTQAMTFRLAYLGYLQQ
jgi:Zn-dependent peptidase ImmA (M78 family)